MSRNKIESGSFTSVKPSIIKTLDSLPKEKSFSIGEDPDFATSVSAYHAMMRTIGWNELDDEEVSRLIMSERKKSVALPTIKGASQSLEKPHKVYKRFMKVTSDPSEEDIEFQS